MAIKCSQIRWEHIHWWGLNICWNFLCSKLTKIENLPGAIFIHASLKVPQQQNLLRHTASQNLRAVENKGNDKNSENNYYSYHLLET